MLKRLAAIALLLVTTSAQASETPAKIWDVPFGTAVTALGPAFVDPACGTAGGPRGTMLQSFADFAACPREAVGLREIWFRYDDEQELVALAYRTPVAALQNRLTAVNGQRALLSFLVDDSGHVQGFRIFTDPRAPERERYDAHVVSGTLRALVGKDWRCENLPAAAGEEPIEGNFVKARCSFAGKGRTARLTTDFYLRRGQKVLDSNSKRMVNAFESSASLEVVASPPVAPLPARRATPPVPADTPVARFLAGATKDCPGCALCWRRPQGPRPFGRQPRRGRPRQRHPAPRHFARGKSCGGPPRPRQSQRHRADPCRFFRRRPQRRAAVSGARRADPFPRRGPERGAGRRHRNPAGRFLRRDDRQRRFRRRPHQ